MTEPTDFQIGRYRLDGARFYDPATHLWVAPARAGRLRCGIDPLGAETCGDIVALSFEPVGARIARGGAFGYVEAAKFVGPLEAPVGGVVVAHNVAALADPALLNTAPMSTWLVELVTAGREDELAHLLSGRAAVEPWFAAEIERFERQGMIAE